MDASKMGTMPIPKLIITMSLPMMVSMLVQALYNVVDSMFVSRVSEAALTAVSLSFPMQNMLIAVASGTAVGINALLSRSLGEGKRDKASRTAMNGILLGIISSIVFILFGIFGTRWFFEVQHVSGEIEALGIDYLSVVLVCCFVVMQITFERILQATGRTFFTMITQGTGAIINIIFDPIFIFGLCGCPAMGVKGAAIATVLGQFVAMLMALFMNLKKNHDVDFTISDMRPDGQIIKEIYVIGFPSIVMVSIGSVMNFAMNQILLAFTDTACAFYGVYMKMQSFIFMPIFGMNNGLIPIMSYNYGAKNKERILETIKNGLRYALFLMVIGIILFEVFPVQLLNIFAPSKEMLEIGVVGMRIIAIHFALAGICVVLGTSFQALNNSVYSLIVSLLRQLGALLPAAYLLSLSGNLNLVWWSYPIAEVVSLLVSVFFFLRIYKNKIQTII